MRHLVCGMLGCVAVMVLSGCADWDWKNTAKETLKNMCRQGDNCYATCPDGRRTDPNTPYCPGERPQDQPDPY